MIQVTGVILFLCWFYAMFKFITGVSREQGYPWFLFDLFEKAFIVAASFILALAATGASLAVVCEIFLNCR